MNKEVLVSRIKVMMGEPDKLITAKYENGELTSWDNNEDAFEEGISVGHIQALEVILDLLGEDK